MKILILNGANLNMLGLRDPKHYGNMTLEQLNLAVAKHAAMLGHSTEFFQSNHEGDLIDKLQTTDANAVVLNAGAFTHYSYALRDCIECLKIPVVEAHLSDIKNREEFRKTNVLEAVTAAVFLGNGVDSYLQAIDFLSK